MNLVQLTAQNKEKVIVDHTAILMGDWAGDNTILTLQRNNGTTFTMTVLESPAEIFALVRLYSAGKVDDALQYGEEKKEYIKNVVEELHRDGEI